MTYHLAGYTDSQVASHSHLNSSYFHFNNNIEKINENPAKPI